MRDRTSEPGETEVAWTRRTCDGLRALGADVFNATASRFQPAGWPDRWVGHVLWEGWLEFKAEATRLGPLQARVLARLAKRRPGSVLVARRGPLLETAIGAKRQSERQVYVEDHSGQTLAVAPDCAAGLLLALAATSAREDAEMAAKSERFAKAFAVVSAALERSGGGAVVDLQSAPLGIRPLGRSCD